ncbi:hypothetical protein E5342_14165 [Parabacteroides distasonis]|jgi:membrane protein YdbS with pleckstrin-like domain|uniref:DUF4133 domain-containing protein n=1 Tax=Parabacteroides distasonis TaxID=823 RepID=A0A4S2ENA1_PARDI|nr:hypothetical protein E5342_14165 [Parabacteroides distasonis]
MDYPVRKGLESQLKVHGMNTSYFIIYCIAIAVLLVFVVGFLISAMSGDGSFYSFIVAFILCALCSVILRIVLINISVDKRYNKFSKKIYVISNKDLLNSL